MANDRPIQAALAEGVKQRYEAAQMASSDVDFTHLAHRVLDLATLADASLTEYESSS